MSALDSSTENVSVQQTVIKENEGSQLLLSVSYSFILILCGILLLQAFFKLAVNKIQSRDVRLVRVIEETEFFNWQKNVKKRKVDQYITFWNTFKLYIPNVMNLLLLQ